MRTGIQRNAPRDGKILDISERILAVRSFLDWKESERNPIDSRIIESEEELFALAAAVVRKCLGRWVPEGLGFSFTVTEGGFGITCDSGNGPEAMEDASAEVLFSRIRSHQWFGYRSERRPVAQAFRFAEVGDDPFERARAGILAKRIGAAKERGPLLQRVPWQSAQSGRDGAPATPGDQRSGGHVPIKVDSVGERSGGRTDLGRGMGAAQAAPAPPPHTNR